MTSGKGKDSAIICTSRQRIKQPFPCKLNPNPSLLGFPSWMNFHKFWCWQVRVFTYLCDSAWQSSQPLFPNAGPTLTNFTVKLKQIGAETRYPRFVPRVYWLTAYSLGEMDYTGEHRHIMCFKSFNLLYFDKFFR